MSDHEETVATTKRKNAERQSILERIVADLSALHHLWTSPDYPAGGLGYTREFDCPRCGGIHKGLPVFEFMLPVKVFSQDGSYREYAYWCLCPDRGSPIFVAKHESVR